MNLMRFDPYRELASLEDRLHRAFGTTERRDESLAAWAPPVDIAEEKDRILITAELPGLPAGRDLDPDGERHADPLGRAAFREGVGRQGLPPDRAFLRPVRPQLQPAEQRRPRQDPGDVSPTACSRSSCPRARTPSPGRSRSPAEARPRRSTSRRGNDWPGFSRPSAPPPGGAFFLCAASGRRIRLRKPAVDCPVVQAVKKPLAADPSADLAPLHGLSALDPEERDRARRRKSLAGGRQHLRRADPQAPVHPSSTTSSSGTRARAGGPSPWARARSSTRRASS